MHRPGADGEGSEANFLAQPNLPAPLRPGAARHGDALWGVVLGVAAGAQHREQMLVGRVVGEMGDVQETMRLAAALADAAGGGEHG